MPKAVRLILLISMFLSNVSFGEISPEVKALLSRVAEIKGDKPPVDSIAGYPPLKCGTPVMLAFHQQKKLGLPLSAASIVSRPDSLPFAFGGTHFLIHYDTSGQDACFQPNIDTSPVDGVPDYINQVLDIFEFVWSYEVGFLEYIEPLPDNGRGGDDRLDIYLVNLGSGVFGYTIPDPDPNPRPPEYQIPAYIEIDNDFAGTSYGGSLATVLKAAKVTAAHEFFHTIQYAYDESEFDYDNINNPLSYKPWWLEASATWMEDVVYDDINDYLNYLPFFFGNPWMGLGTFSYAYEDRAFHPYGACVWPIFLSEKYGNGFIKSLWEGCATVQGYNLPDVTESLLRFQGTSFDKSLLEFHVWNSKTGDFADPDSSYDEGGLFPMVDTSVFVGTLSSIPIEIGGIASPPEHLGANYIVIRPGGTRGGIGIDFDGDDITDAGWQVATVGRRQGYSPWNDIDVSPGSGLGLGEWRNWNDYFDVTIVVTVAGLTPYYDSYNYQGSVWYDSALVGGSSSPGFELLAAYPSPFIISQQVPEVTIRYSLDRRYRIGELSIWVFDASGSIVKEIENILVNRNANLITWDGKNSNGSFVASGIYILHMEGAGNSSSMKIAVLNNSE